MAAISALFLTAVIGNAGLPAVADATPAENSFPVSELRLKIDEAKALLIKARIGTNRAGSANAVLAVWNNSASDGIKLVKVRNGVSRTTGFAVEYQPYNGVYSDYRVIEPEGYVVLAGKFNVAGHRSRRTAIYTPYAPDLHTPETVAAGRSYLETLLERAAAELDDGDTGSLAVTGQTVTQTVPQRVLMTILIIEHVRSNMAEELGWQRVVEEVLVLLALNRDEAYDHAISRARARGLAQFIKSSYQLTRRRYPGADLSVDFNSGAADHLNVVKAQYCLADWTLTALTPETVADLRLPSFEEELGVYMAAAYNGGERRAAWAYYRYPEAWEKAGHGLRRETVNYVRVFRAVYRQLFRPTEEGVLDGGTFDP